MVRKYAVVTNVRIKCHRENRHKMGLGCIYAGSHCREYRYYGTVTTGGPTQAHRAHLMSALQGARGDMRCET